MLLTACWVLRLDAMGDEKHAKIVQHQMSKLQKRLKELELSNKELVLSQRHVMMCMYFTDVKTGVMTTGADKQGAE